MSQFYTDDETVEETDGIQALGAEMTDDDAPEVEETETVEANGDKPKAEKKSNKTPVPDGFMAPVAFAKHLWGKDAAPQPMYGYLKNNKALQEIVVDRGEGVVPRQIIPVAEGEEWYKGVEARRVERAAAKEAKASEATEEATPESEGTEE